jgi:hypothetical protein
MALPLTFPIRPRVNKALLYGVLEEPVSYVNIFINFEFSSSWQVLLTFYP